MFQKGYFSRTMTVWYPVLSESFPSGTRKPVPKYCKQAGLEKGDIVLATAL